MTGRKPARYNLWLSVEAEFDTTEEEGAEHIDLGDAGFALPETLSVESWDEVVRIMRSFITLHMPAAAATSDWFPKIGTGHIERLEVYPREPEFPDDPT